MTTPAKTKVRLDLDKAGLCLDAVIDIIEALDGEKLDIDYLRQNNAELAEVTRDLLYASETCKLAAQEIYMQYWRVKNYNDPRDSK